MKSRFHKSGILLGAGLCCALSFARGADAIPEGYPVERYSQLWQHCPFTIASVQQEPQAGFAQNLVVVGTGRIDDEDIVTLLNKQSQERITLDATANEQGLKVVSVEIDADPLKTHVTIQKGSEVATLGFDKAQLAMTQSFQPPQPGMPLRPGMNQRSLPIPRPASQGGAQSFNQGPAQAPVRNVPPIAVQNPDQVPSPIAAQGQNNAVQGADQNSAPFSLPAVSQASDPSQVQLGTLPVQAIHDLEAIDALPGGPAAAPLATPPPAPQRVPVSAQSSMPIQEINDLRALNALPGNAGAGQLP